MFGLTPDQQGFLIKISFALSVLVMTYAYYWCAEHEHLLYKYARLFYL